EVMTEEPLFASPDDSVVVATALMLQNHIRHLPIVDNGMVIGTVSIREVIAELTTLAMDNLGLMTMAQHFETDVPAEDEEEVKIQA
ncbi:MAG: CBS domain-containing protein, partial [Thalassovita sp.]